MCDVRCGSAMQQHHQRPLLARARHQAGQAGQAGRIEPGLGLARMAVGAGHGGEVQRLGARYGACNDCGLAAGAHHAVACEVSFDIGRQVQAQQHRRPIQRCGQHRNTSRVQPAQPAVGNEGQRQRLQPSAFQMQQPQLVHVFEADAQRCALLIQQAIGARAQHLQAVRRSRPAVASWPAPADPRASDTDSTSDCGHTRSTGCLQPPSAAQAPTRLVRPFRQPRIA